MKMRSAVALLGLAISFALPALAQQKDALDPQLRQVADTLSKKFDEAYDNNDAAAVAALFTEDAVLVTTQGPIYGREAIEKSYADMFLKFHLSDDKTKADQNSPHTIGTAGNEIWETGDWTAILQAQNGSPVHLQGHNAFVDIREGDDWKVRMEIFNVTPAPAVKPSATTSPSSQ